MRSVRALESFGAGDAGAVETPFGMTATGWRSPMRRRSSPSSMEVAMKNATDSRSRRWYRSIASRFRYRRWFIDQASSMPLGLETSGSRSFRATHAAAWLLPAHAP
jgi:hypothetical protein